MDASEPTSKQDASDKDYAAELPRVPPRTPAESQKAFVVRPGFRVELAAAEPLLRSPVAMDFDEDRRLYVAEFPEYNEYAATKPHGKGCIRFETMEQLPKEVIMTMLKESAGIRGFKDLPRKGSAAC